MKHHRSLTVAIIVSFAALLVNVACGDDDERETPNCDDMSDCITAADGGVPLDGSAD